MHVNVKLLGGSALKPESYFNGSSVLKKLEKTGLETRSPNSTKNNLPDSSRNYNLLRYSALVFYFLALKF